MFLVFLTAALVQAKLYPFNNGAELASYINSQQDTTYDIYIRTATLMALTEATKGAINKEMTEALGFHHAGLEFHGNKGTIINVQKFIMTYSAAVIPTPSNSKPLQAEMDKYAETRHCDDCDTKNAFGYTLTADDNYWHKRPAKSGTITKESFLRYVKYLNGQQFTVMYNLFEISFPDENGEIVTFPRSVCYNIATEGLHYFEVENAFVGKSQNPTVDVSAEIMSFKGNVKSVSIDPAGTHIGYMMQFKLIGDVVKVLPETYKIMKTTNPNVKILPLGELVAHFIAVMRSKEKLDIKELLGIDITKVEGKSRGYLQQLESALQGLKTFFNEGSFYLFYSMPNEKYLGKFDGTHKSNLKLEQFGSSDDVKPQDRYKLHIFEFDFHSLDITVANLGTKWFEYQTTPKYTGFYGEDRVTLEPTKSQAQQKQEENANSARSRKTVFVMLVLFAVLIN